MKKIVCMLMVLALFTSCTKQPPKESQTALPSSDSISTSDTTPSAEKKIAPLPSTLNIDTVTDATVATSFESKDLVADANGTKSLDLTIYDYELFDLVDISTLAIGDTITVSKKGIKVESIEKTKGGLIVINGGIENDGVELSTDDNTVYFESGMDGYKSFYEIGKATFNISDKFKFIDNSDLEKPNQEFTYDEFAEKLKDGQINFTKLNTVAVIQNKEIAEITLSYNP